MSTPTVPGLHHVTILSGDPGENVDFYTRVLGLRMVKKTVNFDDNHTYHLYYGDTIGSPGTILTFFPWPQARPGRNGTGLTQATAFMIPENSTEYWKHRLEQHGVTIQPVTTRFGEEVIQFRDPHGVYIDLIASSKAEGIADAIQLWDKSDVPAEHAIRSFHSVSLNLESVEATGELLSLMGYQFVAKEGNRHRYKSDETQPGAYIDLIEMSYQPGAMGKGIVHHIAFRCADDEQQAYWQQTLHAAGIPVTEVRDRQYFRSIYFQEPGGVLFEIATDIPGFTSDETAEELGTSLKLPQWIESRRANIEANLPELPS